LYVWCKIQSLELQKMYSEYNICSSSKTVVVVPVHDVVYAFEELIESE
jgi:hypothetical protein